ncbi:MAG TPA: hypothetical protein VN193_11710 [Candidatus Angelobacter sp.]|jgi:hypothetical protein|nr:hypothetical protein [Candidatus Angelobacter sp.]
MPDNAAGNFFDDLTNGDKAILGGSLIVLVSMFLPWYGWDLGPFGSESVSGFHSWGLLTFIAFLATVALWLLRGPLSDQFKMPELGVTDAMLFTIFGGVEVLGALVFWLAYKSDFPGAGVKFGVFIAIVGGAVTAAGGYFKQSEPAKVTAPGSVPPPPPPSYGAPTPPPAPSYGAPPPPTTPAPPPPAMPPADPPAGGTPPTV